MEGVLQAVLAGAWLIVALVLAATATLTLWWMLYAWRTPASLADTRFGRSIDEDGEPQITFTLMVPARHEQAVLLDTLRTLAEQTHPFVEILAIIGHDDGATYAVAKQAEAERPDRIRVVVDYSWPKNKPRGLNSALHHVNGQVVGVFDAEDEVHPDLLVKVDALFRSSGAHVVQGGVQLMNHDSSWYSLRNVLEYFFWFRSRLHFHAQSRFIPLGGNTVFVRTDLLRAVGGWDDGCLAEDCELGVRLSSMGARVAVAYEPDLVTREETPDSVRALVKQRTRWNQGFLQVLRKGLWRNLPTRRQRMLAGYTLATPFLQAYTGALVPIALITMIAVKAPVALTLATYVPLLPTIAMVAVEAAGLAEFCRDQGRKARVRDYVRLVVGTIPYNVILAVGATRAVWREVRGQRGWEKTAHVGAHRSAGAPA